MKTSQTENEKSLLIYVQGDRLGDGLQKLPAIATLREAFPGYHITWMAGGAPSIFKTSLSPLVENYVDQIIHKANFGISWKQFFKPSDKEFKFHFIIDTQNVIRNTVLLKRVPHDVFVSPAASFLFSDIKPPSKSQYKNSNLQQRLLILISLVAGTKHEPVYNLDIPGKYRELADQLLPNGPVYIGMAPGAGGRKRCWPIIKYIELAKNQVNAGRTPVFFIGPQETDMIATIKSSVQEAVFPEQETTVDQNGGPLLSLALAEKLAVGIANVSGSGHILASGGKPVIILVGPSNANKFTGTSSSQHIINANDYGGSDMDLIPVTAVIDAVNKLV